MKALSIKNLKKTYKGGLDALKGIDLDVEEGDFFALLGPNGAGKSTAINIISSLVTKSSGKVEILGIDIDQNHSLAKKELAAYFVNSADFSSIKMIGLPCLTKGLYSSSIRFLAFSLLVPTTTLSGFMKSSTA